MHWRTLVVATFLGLILGCGNGHHQSRVIVLGLDGLDPATIDLLISEGRLPNLARLRSDGAYGKLIAAPPLLSPVLWTTIATGKKPTEHGIGHFTAIDRSSGEVMPVTSSMRRVKALWNIASEAGLEAVTVGWWATWPPEPIRGAVVSDHTCYHFLFQGGEAGDAAGAFYPPELAHDLTPMVRRPGDMGFEDVRRFANITRADLERPFDFADEISQLRWALATAHSYTDIGLELWRSHRPDLLMVYIEATDSISHLFGHLFRAHGLAGELAAQQQRYGQAVEQVYALADEIVGRFVEVMDDDTTLVVLSDHGFRLGELHDDPSRTRDLRRVSERFHRELGILYMGGQSVRRTATIDQANQLDIAPTVLSLLGLEPALDMPGRVLAEALEVTPTPRTLATYERGEKPSAVKPADGVVDQEIVNRLQGLGYLENDITSPTGDRILAALEFEAGRFEEAAAAYSRLIEDDPESSELHASLAGCLGAMGRFNEALSALDRALELDPVNTEAYHNRAVIHERRGDPAAAVADYQRAIRCAPEYEPSRRALRRLTGSASAWSPSSDAEREAAGLAQRAAETARHGKYEEAMQLLDQAVRVAPTTVIVFKYQANVAFLMGDYERAERALNHALELEPDNPVLLRNLAAVRAQLASTEP